MALLAGKIIHIVKCVNVKIAHTEKCSITGNPRKQNIFSNTANACVTTTKNTDYV